MTTADGGYDLNRCVHCEERFEADDEALDTAVLHEDRSRPARQHRECMLLGIVGHQFGVCVCTGFDHSRASALELKKRLAAATSDG